MSEKNKNRRQLSQQELERTIQVLLDKRKELWHEIREDIKQDGSAEYQELLQTISQDPGDRAMAELRESTIFSYVELKAEEIQDIDAALRRIDAGEYGRCQDCDRWIRTARLEIMPYAVRCRDCQSKWEAIHK
ncbi:MAG: TraR/DksA family transcriptional regulator [Desulfobacterales bacterium]